MLSPPRRQVINPVLCVQGHSHYLAQQVVSSFGAQVVTLKNEFFNKYLWIPSDTSLDYWHIIQMTSSHSSPESSAVFVIFKTVPSNWDSNEACSFYLRLIWWFFFLKKSIFFKTRTSYPRLNVHNFKLHCLHIQLLRLRKQLHRLNLPTSNSKFFVLMVLCANITQLWNILGFMYFRQGLLILHCSST